MELREQQNFEDDLDLVVDHVLVLVHFIFGMQLFGVDIWSMTNTGGCFGRLLAPCNRWLFVSVTILAR